MFHSAAGTRCTMRGVRWVQSCGYDIRYWLVYAGIHHSGTLQTGQCLKVTQ